MIHMGDISVRRVIGQILTHAGHQLSESVLPFTPGMGAPVGWGWVSITPQKYVSPRVAESEDVKILYFFCVAWPFFFSVLRQSQVPGRWKEKPPCCRWSLWSHCARWEVFKGRKTSWSSSGNLDLSFRILDQEFINADLFIVIKWY